MAEGNQRDRSRAFRRGAFLGALLLGLAALLLPGEPGFAAGGESSGYVISPGDVIDIQVYEQKDLSQTVRVSEEGWISLPLAGEIKTGGMPVEELAKVLTDRYGEYIIKPQVNVFIREYAPKEIFILGEVRLPGIQKIMGRTTLLEALSKAGGVTDSSTDTLTIMRRAKKDQNSEMLTVNISQLMSGEREANLEIKDGDTIFIPRAQYYFVFGEVSRPGSYKWDKELRINVLKAITLAGGFTAKASKGKIKITREEGGAQATLKADLTTDVHPNDIIIVPESFF
jgi:polysaccharide export outer membrane protein